MKISNRDLIKKNKNFIKQRKLEEVQNCKNCSYKYVCPVMKEKVNGLKLEGVEKYKKEIYNGEYYPNDYGWLMEYERRLDNFVEEFISHNLDDKCVYELREIDSIIIEMEKKYDLEDPKISLLCRELIHIILQAYRIDIHLAMSGMNKTIVNDMGEINVVNPLLKERQGYSKLIMDGLQKLEVLSNGEKLNVDINISNVLRRLDRMTEDQIGVIETEVSK